MEAEKNFATVLILGQRCAVFSSQQRAANSARFRRFRLRDVIIMSLKAVHITQDVFFVCTTHALTTEKEEIMGLLLGDIIEVRQIMLCLPSLHSFFIVIVCDTRSRS